MPRHEETIPIPTSKIGLVVGKGGTTIKRIQSEFAVEIKINENSGHGTVKISGEKPAVQKAKWEIENILSGTKSGRGGGRGSGGRGSGRNGGRTGKEWSEYKKRREPSVEALLQLKPTKVHLGDDSKDMVLNLVRYLATGMDAAEIVAAAAGGGVDGDSEDSRAQR